MGRAHGTSLRFLVGRGNSIWNAFSRCSSVGRAPCYERGGHRFDSCQRGQSINQHCPGGGIGRHATLRSWFFRVRIPVGVPKELPSWRNGQTRWFQIPDVPSSNLGEGTKPRQVVQLADTASSNLVSCEFESRLADQQRPLGAIGRRACLRSRKFRVRVTERAPYLGQWRNRQTPTP